MYISVFSETCNEIKKKVNSMNPYMPEKTDMYIYTRVEVTRDLIIIDQKQKYKRLACLDKQKYKADDKCHVQC